MRPVRGLVPIDRLKISTRPSFETMTRCGLQAMISSMMPRLLGSRTSRPVAARVAATRSRSPTRMQKSIFATPNPRSNKIDPRSSRLSASRSGPSSVIALRADIAAASAGKHSARPCNQAPARALTVSYAIGTVSRGIANLSAPRSPSISISESRCCLSDRASRAENSPTAPKQPMLIPLAQHAIASRKTATDVGSRYGFKRLATRSRLPVSAIRDPEIRAFRGAEPRFTVGRRTHRFVFRRSRCGNQGRSRAPPADDSHPSIARNPRPALARHSTPRRSRVRRRNQRRSS